MSRNKIDCPLCGGTGASRDHECPECKGTGRVPNVFGELRHGSYETDEETAAAECRPLADVQAEAERATNWLEASPANRPESADTWVDYCTEVLTLAGGPTGTFVEVLELAVHDYGDNELWRGKPGQQPKYQIRVQLVATKTGQPVAGGNNLI
jgi:hypothetical protein